jgi:tRNA threonylcarbamoyladenosine biosynthesis protein TsaE
VVTVQVLETANESETESAGAKFARRLSRGDVVLVRGELGAGKTTFVRGAARALGVQGPVTSPTFSIAHRYEGKEVIVCHLDLYRLTDLGEEDPALLADHTGEDDIAFIEWPESAERELTEAKAVVTLRHAGGDKRVIEVRAWA